ncbi:MAG: hypothetical protein AB1726_08505 [Planctomycetota bacterium]
MSAAIVPVRLLLAALLAPAPASPRPPEAGPELRVELLVSPAVDLWFAVRARAEEASEPAPEDPWLPAVRAAREAAQALGDPRAFGLIEGRIARCADGAALRAALATLPEDFAPRGSTGERRPIALRKIAAGMGAALAGLEDAWLREAWPARRVRLEEARRALEPAFAGERGAALAARVQKLVGLAPSSRAVPVHLVLSAPAPGGFTHRAKEGGVSFVAVEGRGGSLLLEIVLHELLHAFDAEPGSAASLPAALRRALGEAGVEPADPAAHQAVHALFFLAAAAAVRGVVDPAHVDYGESSGLYGRLGPAGAIVRSAWERRRRGELDEAAFVAGVARAVAAEVGGRRGGASGG